LEEEEKDVRAGQENEEAAPRETRRRGKRSGID
jgi:hypothetical protein